MKRLFQMRAGAPDKFRMFTSGNYELIKRNGVNLTSYSVYEINILSPEDYVVSTSEDDIKYIFDNASTIKKEVQRRLFLPCTSEGIIDYYRFVPKDSEFYKGIMEGKTMFTYPLKHSFTIEEFKEWYPNHLGPGKFVIKVQKGSGSRGVAVINKDREPQVGAREQYKELTEDIAQNIIHWATIADCKILIQELAYRDLNQERKYNLNFMIKNKKLLLYKINLPDNDSTNYDHAVFYRSEWSDRLVNSVVDYMVNDLGIEEGLFGIDGYTNFDDFTTMLECNWRHENSFFEFEALGIDFLDAYLFPEKYSMDMIPFGETPFIRYWRCAKFDLNKGGILA